MASSPVAGRSSRPSASRIFASMPMLSETLGRRPQRSDGRWHSRGGRSCRRARDRRTRDARARAARPARCSPQSWTVRRKTWSARGGPRAGGRRSASQLPLRPGRRRSGPAAGGRDDARGRQSTAQSRRFRRLGRRLRARAQTADLGQAVAPRRITSILCPGWQSRPKSPPSRRSRSVEYVPASRRHIFGHEIARCRRRRRHRRSRRRRLWTAESELSEPSASSSRAASAASSVSIATSRGGQRRGRASSTTKAAGVAARPIFSGTPAIATMPWSVVGGASRNCGSERTSSTSNGRPCSTTNRVKDLSNGVPCDRSSSSGTPALPTVSTRPPMTRVTIAAGVSSIRVASRATASSVLRDGWPTF